MGAADFPAIGASLHSTVPPSPKSQGYALATLPKLLNASRRFNSWDFKVRFGIRASSPKNLPL